MKSPYIIFGGLGALIILGWLVGVSGGIVGMRTQTHTESPQLQASDLSVVELANIDLVAINKDLGRIAQGK